MTVEDFKKDLKIVDSERSQMKLLAGLFGGSGGGKTGTGLIWALGMVGPDADIGVIDTEQKRSTLAADWVYGLAEKHFGKPVRKFKTIHIGPPFHPLKFVAAFQELVDAGCKAIVGDSLSHAWNGDGGYLDLKEEALNRMAGDDWKKREACAMAAAAKVKPHTHNKLFNCITQLPVHAILCFRGVEKTKMQQGDNNKVKPQKDGYLTPIQEAGIIFEMLISGEVTNGGYCSFQGPGRKYTHPAILSLLPKEDERFGFSHGQAIAQWCANPTSRPAESKTAQDGGLKALKLTLWNLTKHIHNGQVEKLEEWLRHIKALGEDQSLESITNPTELSFVLDKAKISLAE